MLRADIRKVLGVGGKSRTMAWVFAAVQQETDRVKADVVLAGELHVALVPMARIRRIVQPVGAAVQLQSCAAARRRLRVMHLPVPAGRCSHPGCASGAKPGSLRPQLLHSPQLCSWLRHLRRLSATANAPKPTMVTMMSKTTTAARTKPSTT